MGRGIAYPYDFFMLYEEDSFRTINEDESENIEDDIEVVHALVEWDDFAFEDFLKQAATALRADQMTRTEYKGRESYYFAESNTVKVGIDHSGGGPCIFVTPKAYLRGNDEIDYSIKRQVNLGFNRLCKMYGPDMFSLASSAWTSSPIKKYHPMLYPQAR